MTEPWTVGDPGVLYFMVVFFIIAWALLIWAISLLFSRDVSWVWKLFAVPSLAALIVASLNMGFSIAHDYFGGLPF